MPTQRLRHASAFSVTDRRRRVATGTGAATSDSDTIKVTVNPVNDPVTSSAPATATPSTRTASVALSGLSISDVHGTLSAEPASYSVTSASAHGTLTLSTLAGLTFDSG